MDRITKSLLDEFSRDYGLDGLNEDDRFEHLASYVTVHRQYSETFDTSEIVLGDTPAVFHFVPTLIATSARFCCSTDCTARCAS